MCGMFCILAIRAASISPPRSVWLCIISKLYNLLIARAIFIELRRLHIWEGVLGMCRAGTATALQFEGLSKKTAGAISVTEWPSRVSSPICV